MRHFITSYRNTLYHLNEFQGCRPSNERELFNHQHSSCHNIIERIFEVLKKRFGIKCEELMYSFEKQKQIFIACCCVHNHIRRYMLYDKCLEDVELEASPSTIEEVNAPPASRFVECRAGHSIRKRIAKDMWRDLNHA